MSFESNLTATFFFLSCVLGVPLLIVALINRFKKIRRENAKK